jgi:hypothetical protein
MVGGRKLGVIWARALPCGCAALAAAVWTVAAPAFADSSYTVTATTPDLGRITSGATGDTVFRINSLNGNVTVISGTGVRNGSSSVRSLVTIQCTGASGDCSKDLNVRVGVIGSPIGRARTLAHILAAMGTAVLTSTPFSGNGFITFTIGPIGLNSSKTFWVGADFGVAGDDSGLPTGAAESDFSVLTSEVPAVVANGPNGGFTATVIRGLSISKTSDLVFGTVAKPSSGSGTVAIDAVSGARTLTGGAVGLGSPTPTRAAFSVTGEGGQTISVTVPASFQMTGPQPITVTTTNSATGSLVLSGALGSAGSYAFGVGGSAPVAFNTPDGNYTGSFTVTVAYN